MTTDDAQQQQELPQGAENDKPRYAILAAYSGYKIWLIRPEPPHHTFINTFAARHQARAAVMRYLRARNIAKQIGCRLP